MTAKDGAVSRGNRWLKLRTAAGAALLGLACLWAVGQVFRDATWLTGLCFYLPSPVLATAMAGAACACLLTKRRRAALVVALLALPPLVFVLFVENNFAARPTAAGTAEHRLVHWNIASGLDRQDLRDVLVAQQADLYVLSEVSGGESLRALADGLGGGRQAAVVGDMAVVGHGEVESAGRVLSRRGAQAYVVVWRCEGRELTVLAVDLPSSVLVPRDPLLREVRKLIERHRPDLIVGDFNAPRRSRGLSNLPPDYRHAYDAVGAGWGYTWPVPVPVYAIDQCICGPGVVPVRYELRASAHSDHRLQVLDFALAPPDAR